MLDHALTMPALQHGVPVAVVKAEPAGRLAMLIEALDKATQVPLLIAIDGVPGQGTSTAAKGAHKEHERTATHTPVVAPAP
jgi:hypothetical protein